MRGRSAPAPLLDAASPRAHLSAATLGLAGAASARARGGGATLSPGACGAWPPRAAGFGQDGPLSAASSTLQGFLLEAQQPSAVPLPSTAALLAAVAAAVPPPSSRGVSSGAWGPREGFAPAFVQLGLLRIPSASGASQGGSPTASGAAAAAARALGGGGAGGARGMTSPHGGARGASRFSAAAAAAAAAPLDGAGSSWALGAPGVHSGAPLQRLCSAFDTWLSADSLFP
jgi:hypothetical protein